MEVDGPFLETAHYQPFDQSSSFGPSTLSLLDHLVSVFWTVQLNLHGPFTLDLTFETSFLDTVWAMELYKRIKEGDLRDWYLDDVIYSGRFSN